MGGGLVLVRQAWFWGGDFGDFGDDDWGELCSDGAGDDFGHRFGGDFGQLCACGHYVPCSGPGTRASKAVH